MALAESKVEIPEDLLRQVFGQFDCYLKKIERTLNVTVISRDGELKIVGAGTGPEYAKKVLEDLARIASSGAPVTEQNVDYDLSLALEHHSTGASEFTGDVICHTVSGKSVSPKTYGQKEYVESIRDHMITFGIGPAGTGKTYLAMAMAITAFKNEDVSRIIMTRPAIEAGEKLGFLPGDLQSKVDPYLRPLYDALYQIMGPESCAKNLEKGLIEVAPLAYMRGRTLDNAFIILDEAQNTTPAQMKMFLTRIGFGSKVIVTGDLTQKDLPFETKSGLEVAVDVLRRIEDIAFCRLTSRDVVRHPLVQKIVQAYEAYEKNHDTELRKRNPDHARSGRGRRGSGKESHQGRS